MTNDYITQDKFLWARLWMHIKREIESNKNQLKWQTAVIVGLVISIEALSCYILYYNWQQEDAFYNSALIDPVQIPLIIIFTLFGLLIITIASSTTFSPLKTKADKINQIMSVGTQSEKFWARALIYAVAPAFVFLASVCVVDLIRCLLVDIIMPIKPLFVLDINILLLNSSDDVQSVLLFSAITACLSAFFMTLSVYSPKYTFIKGACLLLVLLGGIIIFFYDYSSLLSGWMNYLDLAYWTLLICLVAITVVLFIASYFKYKEIEL